MNIAYLTEYTSWLGNRMFDRNSECNVNDVLERYITLKKYLMSFGVEFNTYDIYTKENEIDYWLVQEPLKKHLEFLSSKCIDPKKIIFFLHEPPVFNPWGWDYIEKNNKLFAGILTWESSLTKNRDNYQHYHFPVDVKLEEYAKFKNKEKKKLLLMMHSNKFSAVFGELYSFRRSVVRYYERRKDKLLDLIGYGWNTNNHPSPFFTDLYAGTVNNKKEKYSEYYYSFCIDNCVMPGYITYDPLISMSVGTVPIYLPMPDSVDFIPENTFIDLSKWKNLDDLTTHLFELIETGEYEIYRKNGKEFLESEKFYTFTIEKYCKDIYKGITDIVSLSKNDLNKSILVNEKYVKTVINEHFMNIVRFNVAGVVRLCNPLDILTYNRIDVIVKYLYVKFREKHINSDFARKLYKEHLRIFNGFNEGDGSNKTSYEKFVESFEYLIDSLKKNKFDHNKSLIPVTFNNELIDGSHRLGVSLYFELTVPVLITNHEGWKYTPKYFLKKGLDEKIVEFLILEYCKLKKNIRIVNLFPSAIGNDNNVKKILEEYGVVVYEKRIRLENYGAILFIKQLYGEENWLGDWQNGYSGARSKANYCFTNNDFMRIYVLEAGENEDLVEAKSRIRKIYNIDKHSVHINDSHEDSLNILKVILNENSLYFLNSNKFVQFSNFNKLFFDFKKYLKLNALDKDNYCITGSAVLSLFGLRDCADIDYLHFGDEIEGIQNINSHNKEIKNYSLSIDDIILNPQNHFYFDGIKFATIKVIYEMKIKRGEDKDKKDINLINECVLIKNGISAYKEDYSLPKFSIILANYNAAKYLDISIGSVISQTFREWELLIIDDASSDSSIEVITKYLSDKRIKLIRHEVNMGYVAALRTGIANLKSDFFGTLDADDALLDNAVDTMYKAHLENPLAGYIYSQFVYCDDNLNPKYLGYCKKIAKNKTALESDSVSHFKTFKLKYYLKTSGFDKEILHAEDKDISYKMEEVSLLHYVNSVLYLYRELANSISHITENRKMALSKIPIAKSNAILRRDEKCKKLQSHALSLFVKAKDLFAISEFENAENLIKLYKNEILYNQFAKYDNRLNNYPELSIIIVAYNSNENLIRCLDSVFRNRYENYEVIVVDNGLNDDFIEKLILYPILYIKTPFNLYPSEGRNIGVYFAKSDIVAFLDDDAIVEDDYIINILISFNKYNIIALRGKVVPLKESFYNKYATHYNLGEINFYTYIDTEGNSAFKKEAYISINGMNPLLFGGEGLEISQRIIDEFGKSSVLYVKDVIIYHNYSDTENKFITKTTRHMLMRNYLLSKYKKLLTDYEISLSKKVEANSNNIWNEIKIFKLFLVYPDTTHAGKSVYSNLKGNLYHSLLLSNSGYNILYNRNSECNKLVDFHSTSIWITEPIVVIPENYDLDYLSKFEFVFTWNRKILEKLENGTYLPHAHWGFDSLAKNIGNSLCSWSKRRKKIVIIANNKSSNHPSNLYDLRIEMADYFYNHSEYELNWYGKIPIDKPYYKGEIEDKLDATTNARFMIVLENCFDELYSYDYLTEKLIDAFNGKIVPIYLGCFNIEEYIPKDLYIDLRKFINENLNIDYLSLIKVLEDYDENDYLRYCKSLDEFYISNVTFFKEREWISLYENIFNTISQKSNYYLQVNNEKKRIDKGYIFAGDYYLQNEVKKLIAEFGIKSIVETGTQYGNSTEEMCKLCENVYSIEINEELYLKAKQKLKKYKNVELFLGNSPEVMNQILPEIPKPILFFLDAHWYDYWPVLDELKQIKLAGLKDSVIIIHDFYVPNSDLGYDEYNNQKLDWEFIKDAIKNINSEYSFYYNTLALGKKRGAIFITPPKLSNLLSPFISICITTFNKTGYFKDAFYSALQQTYKNFEIIVIDQNEDNLISDFINTFNNSKIKYFKKKKNNTPDASNLAINASKGDYILWLEDEDFLDPRILDVYVGYINRNPNIDVLYCNLMGKYPEKENQKKIVFLDYYKDNYKLISSIFEGKRPFSKSSTLIRKNIYSEVGLYNIEFDQDYDFEFILRLLLQNKFTFKNVEDYLCYFRNDDDINTIRFRGFVDHYHEARIIVYLAENTNLKVLFPDEDWNRSPEDAVANANFFIGLRLAKINCFKDSLKYLGISFNISPIFERFIQVVEYFLQFGKIKELYILLQVIKDKFVTYVQIKDIEKLLKEYLDKFS